MCNEEVECTGCDETFDSEELVEFEADLDLGDGEVQEVQYLLCPSCDVKYDSGLLEDGYKDPQ